MGWKEAHRCKICGKPFLHRDHEHCKRCGAEIVILGPRDTFGAPSPPRITDNVGLIV